MDDLTLAARFRVMAATGMAATIQPADLKAAAEMLDRAEHVVAAYERFRKSRADVAAACDEAVALVRAANKALVVYACVAFAVGAVLGAVAGWVLA